MASRRASASVLYGTDEGVVKRVSRLSRSKTLRRKEKRPMALDAKRLSEPATSSRLAGQSRGLRSSSRMNFLATTAARTTRVRDGYIILRNKVETNALQ